MIRDEKNKDLRWNIAFEITNGDFQDKTSGEIADSILSLPTELIKVEKCKYCNGEGNHKLITKKGELLGSGCAPCHGSGELTTPLTLGEAVELLKHIIEPPGNTWPIITLPDGSKVRRNDLRPCSSME